MTEDEQLDYIIDFLRSLDLESLVIDTESEPVMAGGSGPFDPAYEAGPYRLMRPTGRHTITIVGTYKEPQ